MITNLDFTPTAKHRERLWLITGTALTFVVMLASNASAQDIKTPFGPDEARLYLRNAADKARLIQKQKSKTFEEFKASVTKEPFEGGKYIVNGDTPIATEAELRTFYEENVEASPKEVSEFTVMRKLGKDIIWSDEKKKNISYCVASAAADIGGFGSRYNTVVWRYGRCNKGLGGSRGCQVHPCDGGGFELHGQQQQSHVRCQAGEYQRVLGTRLFSRRTPRNVECFDRQFIV